MVKYCAHSNNASKQYFLVAMFVILLESGAEILKCDHSNESYWAVLSCGANYYAAQDGSIF